MNSEDNVWRIDGEPEEMLPAGYDGRIWRWRLGGVENPEDKRSVIVRMSGTALRMAAEALPTRAVLARDSQGGTEVGMVCGWPEPPGKIDVHSDGVDLLGGEPAPEQREINEIVEWFDERGAIVIFAARGYGSGPPDQPPMISMTKHAAHVIARDHDEYIYNVEAHSRLEAARKAKQQWEDEKRGRILTLTLQDRVTLSDTVDPKVEQAQTPAAEREGKAAEAAKAAEKDEAYTIRWKPLTDDPAGESKPPHWVEVVDSDGEVIQAGLGDDVEDSALDSILAMLPTWGKPPKQI